jgi:hypothetical protein
VTLNNPFVAQQRITDAQKARADVAKLRQEEWVANRQSLDKFYERLALLSGGSIALSVTYLGFLKTTTDQPRHMNLLILSWSALFLCLLCATFFSFFNTSYIGFARGRADG